MSDPAHTRNRQRDLLADRRRLEWMIEHEARLYRDGSGWCCEWEHGVGSYDTYGVTPNEAIDAGMKESSDG